MDSGQEDGLWRAVGSIEGEVGSAQDRLALVEEAMVQIKAKQRVIGRVLWVAVLVIIVLIARGLLVLPDAEVLLAI